MSVTVSYPEPLSATRPNAGSLPPLKVWAIASLAGASTAWPLIYAALMSGPQVLLRWLTGDSYHYLTIARKAAIYHIYTYDGVHVTNGFHPLWQYSIRAVFTLFGLHSHEAQGVAVMMMALCATTLGVILASAATVRMTNQYFLGLLLVPGLYYMVAGVHVRNLSIWSAFNGMESAPSILFGGLLFFVFSRYYSVAARESFDTVGAYRALGWVLPFLILSRLDDVFLLPALLISLFFFEPDRTKQIRAGLWIATPTSVAILCYLAYNKATAGAAMPLSGATKAGFVGPLSAYLSLAVHFPLLLDLKAFLSRKSADGAVLFDNSFRMIECLYPLIAAAFGSVAIWRYKRRDRSAGVLFAICLYILFKASYNFLFVHPWNQSDWYYAFTMLSLSVLGALALKTPWERLACVPIAKYGVATVYLAVMMLSASQYYATLAYQPQEPLPVAFWNRGDEIRRQLVEHGVGGIINVDDGISAFLLDLPSMHGFAFATDLEAQRAHKSGRMLSLAYSRGINSITGFGYVATDNPPRSNSDIRAYLRNSLAIQTMFAELDDFDFSLAYYDPVLKMPFFSFQPHAKDLAK
jgi:hypothetical protein